MRLCYKQRVDIRYNNSLPSVPLWLLISTILTVSVLVGSHEVTVASSSKAFEARRFPFVPTLVENRNPDLCMLALQEAHARFHTPEPDTRVRQTNGGGVSWLDWQEAAALGDSHVRMSRLDLDLDGTGEHQVLLSRVFSHSWRGDNHYAYLLPSATALQTIMDHPGGLTAAFARLDNRHREPAAATDPAPYYPQAQLANAADNQAVNTGSEWEEHRLFHWRQRYYFYDESNAWGRMGEPSLRLYRLRGDGKVELQCTLQVLPDEAVLTAFRRLPGIASFLTVLSTIGDGGVGWCGTMNSGYRHNGEAKAAITRAAFRPWAVSRAVDSYYQYDERMQRFLEHWSFGEVWNRREYQTFVHHIPPAMEAMERYLLDAFGLSPAQANTWARQVIEELIGAWILAPKSYTQHHDLDDLAYAPITGALLHFDATALRQAIDAFQAEAPKAMQQKNISVFLHDAVEWDTGMEMLLAAGANPNYQLTMPEAWGFGKTPLMTAAHMNRPDTLRRLLKHGADPHARTVAAVDQCGLRIERGSRSALMYAAENAAPEVMGLLLDAGADPTVQDSKGNGLSFYLALNPRLSEAEKLMDIRAFVQAKRQAYSASACGEATAPLAQHICNNELLRILEREMTAAVVRWQSVGGAVAQDEQLRWLQARQQACHAGEQAPAIGCLQQLMRARVRYLHNRLAE